MLTDHWAVDVPLSPPFKHDTVGAGAIAGVGKIGRSSPCPSPWPCNTGSSRPTPNGAPIGDLGLTYAKFFRNAAPPR